jgi:glycosyltransferase involved in cell wall biosynthesis
MARDCATDVQRNVVHINVCSEKNCIAWSLSIVASENRVLHILWSGRAGGAERFVSDIITYADNAVFEHAVCFLSHGGACAATMEERGAQVFYLNMDSGFSASRGIRIRRLIQRIAPCIIQIHCRNYIANAMIATFAEPKRIYFEHGSDLIAHNKNREIRFYRMFGHRYDLIMANSYYTRDRILTLTGVEAQKVTVFYIGVDHALYRRAQRDDTMKQELGFAKGDTVIGTIGRLVEQKGIDDFVLAAVEIAKLRSACRFVVVGEGDKRAELERMAHTHHIDITFLGERLDIPDIINTFDLFLSTSKWEPFGIAVLEALAASVPVVGYSVPGMREIIDRGGGILVEKRDPLILARTAVDVLTDREQYASLQGAGLANVRAHFDIRKRMKELESLYMQLLSAT